MADFQDAVAQAIQNFVARINELAQRAAIETLEGAFGGQTHLRAIGAVRASSNVKPSQRPSGRGAKRTVADLEALSEKVASFIKSNPGLRVEQINKELGLATKELALPIRKLIAEGRVTSKGQKRSTTYFPGRKAR